MSKKGNEVFQTKITRNDRFAQMSHQEKVIEQKKREIQAKLEQKQKGIFSNAESKPHSSPKTTTKSPMKLPEKKPSFSFNTFSNDGSFLDQFRHLKDKKPESKGGKFLKTKDNNNDKQYHDDRNKGTRWSQRRESQSPKDRGNKGRSTRFDIKSSYEPKININATYSSLMSQNNYELQQQQVTAENVTGQPLLKNIITTQGISFTNQSEQNTSIIAAPPLLLNVPPPQVLQTTITGQIINSSGMEQVLNVGPLTTVNIQRSLNDVVNQAQVINVPPPCLPPQIELSSIPPPNPIQVHNIPQPEPLNALNIPHPAPLQVQNIPPPSPIQLNEIPNPKPLDLMNIPTPSEICMEKNMTDAEFIKNVPPPNKSVPPPNLDGMTVNVTLPPPSNVQTAAPSLLTTTTIPPPQNENISQNIILHTIPISQAQLNSNAQLTLHQNVQVLPPHSLNQLINAGNTSVVQTQMQLPPNVNEAVLQNFVTIPIQNQLPVTVVPPPQVSVANQIQNMLPSVINQNLTHSIPPPNINMNCPPPLLQTANAIQIQMQGGQPQGHIQQLQGPQGQLQQLQGPQGQIQQLQGPQGQLQQLQGAQGQIQQLQAPQGPLQIQQGPQTQLQQLQNLPQTHMQALQGPQNAMQGALGPPAQLQGTLMAQTQLQQLPQQLQGPPSQLQAPQLQSLQGPPGSMPGPQVHMQQLQGPQNQMVPMQGPQIALQALQGPQLTFINHPPPLPPQMPPMNVPPPAMLANQQQHFHDVNAGTAHYEAMASLGRMVAQCGPGIEDIVKQKKPQDPDLWFLFHKESAAYQQYQQLIQQFKMEQEEGHKPEELYEPEMASEDERRVSERDDDAINERKRKRKSRWGEKAMNVPHQTITATNANQNSTTAPVMLSKVTRSDTGLLQYVMNTYGTTNLNEDDWKKAEDSYKINLLYQDMMRKKKELEKLQQQGKNKYEYDSDEEVAGGTWEHKLREKEMMATQLWAQELTRQADGKHHIGDFLPPEELKKFLEKSTAVKEGRTPNMSDYKEFKIKEDNIGFKMLQKFGWSEGQGLGSNSTGIVEPINKGPMHDQNQGLGLEQPENLENDDDEYDAYRKRMMLAYRFRPNPLNNPRRPYY